MISRKLARLTRFCNDRVYLLSQLDADRRFGAVAPHAQPKANIDLPAMLGQAHDLRG